MWINDLTWPLPITVGLFVNCKCWYYIKAGIHTVILYDDVTLPFLLATDFKQMTIGESKIVGKITISNGCMTMELIWYCGTQNSWNIFFTVVVVPFLSCHSFSLKNMTRVMDFLSKQPWKSYHYNFIFFYSTPRLNCVIIKEFCQQGHVKMLFHSSQ